MFFALSFARCGRLPICFKLVNFNILAVRLFCISILIPLSLLLCFIFHFLNWLCPFQQNTSLWKLAWYFFCFLSFSPLFSVLFVSFLSFYLFSLSVYSLFLFILSFCLFSLSVYSLFLFILSFCLFSLSVYSLSLYLNSSFWKWFWNCLL